MNKKRYSIMFFLFLVIIPPNNSIADFVIDCGKIINSGVYLGMSKEDLILNIGSPNRIKSEGRCFQYYFCDLSIFFDKDMKAEKIYLGRNFSGKIKQKSSGSELNINRITYEIKKITNPCNLNYSPSPLIQTQAFSETEDEITPSQGNENFIPKEYRGKKKLYALFNDKRQIVKYKYVMDDDGIAFWLDQNKKLYTIAIYKHYPAAIESEKYKEIIAPSGVIHFDFDKYTLNENQIPILVKWIEFLKQNPAVIIFIKGHADSRGRNEYNLKLSGKRVETVYNYLVKKGIVSDRIRKAKYGASKPFLITSKEEKKSETIHSKNRRVEILIDKDLP